MSDLGEWCSESILDDFQFPLLKRLDDSLDLFQCLGGIGFHVDTSCVVDEVADGDLPGSGGNR